MEKSSLAYHEELGDLYYYYGASLNFRMEQFHYHHTHELILVMSNHVTVNIESYSYEANEGDVILIRSGEKHQILPQDSNSLYRRYVLMFDPKPLEKLAEAVNYDFLRYYRDMPSTLFIPKLSLSEKNRLELIRKFNKIDPLYSRQDEEALALIYLTVADILIYVQNLYDFFSWNKSEDVQSIEPATTRDHESEKERISEIKQYIRDHLDRKILLDDIADSFFISKYYLSRYFKRETGFNIMAYVTQQKMIAAKRMLLQGMSIRRIANDLGYNNDSHFISTFQKYTGITPKQYLKSLNNEDKNN